MDYTQLTDEQLAAESAALMAEMQKRSAVHDLEDRVINAIMDAKNMGFTRGQVVAAIANMVQTAYGVEQV